jgi:hypothetical protein
MGDSLFAGLMILIVVVGFGLIGWLIITGRGSLP